MDAPHILEAYPGLRDLNVDFIKSINIKVRIHKVCPRFEKHYNELRMVLANLCKKEIINLKEKGNIALVVKRGLIISRKDEGKKTLDYEIKKEKENLVFKWMNFDYKSWMSGKEESASHHHPNLKEESIG